MVYCSNADLSTAQHNLQNNLDSGLSIARLQTNQLSVNVRRSHVKLKLQNHELSVTVGSVLLSKAPSQSIVEFT